MELSRHHTFPNRNDDWTRQECTRREMLRAGVVAAFGLAWFPSARANSVCYKPAVSGRPPPPRSAFGADSTACAVTAGLELKGMTAVLTGCNSGIGFETMRVLAARGVHVGGARTLANAEKACGSVSGPATPLVIELTDFDGVVAAAEKVKASAKSIDMLILNAGIMALPELQQVNGVECQFVVNHLGHFLLADRLRDSVVAARQGRVVVVSSSAHVWAPKEGIG